jgi:HEAT repeat protein
MNKPIRNEPEIKVKGGAIRTSKRIDRSELPALKVRERVLNVLRKHCPDSHGFVMPVLMDSDFAMVRIIAQEGAISNTESTVRYNAIAALASSGTPENLNLLIDLAHFGEDFYVRGHALLALGATGMQIALPAITGHLTATHKFEQSAARKAIALIAKKTSVESVKAHVSLLNEKSKAEVSRILIELGEAKKRGEVKMTPQKIKGRDSL